MNVNLKLWLTVAETTEFGRIREEKTTVKYVNFLKT